MIIRIKKCTDPRAWYADRVGQTMVAERFEKNRRPEQGIPEDVYWCREGGYYNPINYVRASDAEVVNGPSAEFTSAMPDSVGLWEFLCWENDGMPERCAITSSGDCHDPAVDFEVHSEHLGRTPLKHFHEGLTNIKWMKIA